MRAMASMCWLLFAVTAVPTLAFSTKPSDVTASNLLYAVPSGGTFFVASPPVSKVDDAHSWIKSATKILVQVTGREVAFSFYSLDRMEICMQFLPHMGL